ncbi:hypothetical protein SNE40_004698 [Patella caerulea]|uniref:SGNH domain-containing protein n=2 Tax=Patella caerulea TaxID=87958 RepID=A0AAN8K9C6_PATCE
MLISVVSLITVWIWLIMFSHPILQNNFQSKYKLRYPTFNCPDVLRYMTQGKWIPEKVTLFAQMEIDIFLEKARKDFYLPGTLQRWDNKCGNVTFDWLIGFQQPLLWFRALCDPKGENPCCYDNMCTNRPIEMCKCPGCYDMRQQVNAEYARWTSVHPGCQVPLRSLDYMCNSLKDVTIYFIGDSFIRHMYTAFLMLITGDMYDGAMATELMSPYNHSKCVGMYAFSERDCRGFLQPKAELCHKSLNVEVMELPRIDNSDLIFRTIKKLENRPKSMVVMGIGIHDNYNSEKTADTLLSPIVTKRLALNQTWPKLLWAAPHAPGLLKTPRVPEQSHASVIKFNDNIRIYLSQWNIPIFDSFNLTDGVNSFDGAHYGLGVNLIKAKILIEYIGELRSREKW